MKKNIQEMLLARGVGILLVTLGHSEPVKFVYPKLFAFIYTFHMPLFFFLSGFFAGALLRVDSLHTYFQVVGRKIKFLIVPYLVVSISYIFLKSVFASQVRRPVVIHDVFIDILFFPDQSPALFLWFLYTLMMMVLLTPLVSKIKWYIVLAALVILSMIDVPITLFSLNTFCKYYLYYFVALQLGTQKELFFKFLRKKYFFPVLVPIMGLLYGLLIRHYFVFGSVLMAFIGMATVLTLCFSYRHVLPERSISYLGKHSFEIYLLQYYFIFPVSVVCLKFFPPGAVVLFSFIVGILGPVCLSHWVLPRSYWLSWFFGGVEARNRDKKAAVH